MERTTRVILIIKFRGLRAPWCLKNPCTLRRRDSEIPQEYHRQAKVALREKGLVEGIKAIAAVLARLERHSERTLGALRTQGPARVYELCKRLYPYATERRFWQTASSVQGQLYLLEERDQAIEREGAWEAR